MSPTPPEIPDWDQYYLQICKVVAARSKDPNTQIGCVIIGPAREIRTTGYNSFPRGIRDDIPERKVRPIHCADDSLASSAAPRWTSVGRGFAMRVASPSSCDVASVVGDSLTTAHRLIPRSDRVSRSADKSFT